MIDILHGISLIITIVREIHKENNVFFVIFPLFIKTRQDMVICGGIWRAIKIVIIQTTKFVKNYVN